MPTKLRELSAGKYEMQAEAADADGHRDDVGLAHAWVINAVLLFGLC